MGKREDGKREMSGWAWKVCPLCQRKIKRFKIYKGEMICGHCYMQLIIRMPMNIFTYQRRYK
jgi:hypothetical protein